MPPGWTLLFSARRNRYFWFNREANATVFGPPDTSTSARAL